ncbi:MAG: lipopolysaccharide heptosyltransferase II [bacterium]
MKQPVNPAARTRILVVKLSSLGDLFHVLPAVRLLKSQLNASVDWVTQTEYAPLVECFPDVRRVIPFPRRRKQGSRLKFLRELWRFRYDYIIDFQGLMKSALITRLARGTRRIGPSFHREWSSLFYTTVTGPKNKDRHAVDENIDVVRHLGLELGAPEFPLAFPDVSIDTPAPRVAIVPVTRWKNKCWPWESFVAAGRQLRSRTGASLYIVGSAEDQDVCRRISEEIGGPVVNLAGRTSIVEMGSLLAKMDIVLCNDSGPMHVAAALNVPLVAVFGPTDPRRTGPYGQLHHVLMGRNSCQPCMDDNCKLGVVVCMREVTPAAVVDLAARILELGSGSAPSDQG